MASNSGRFPPLQCFPQDLCGLVLLVVLPFGRRCAALRFCPQKKVTWRAWRAWRLRWKRGWWKRRPWARLHGASWQRWWSSKATRRHIFWGSKNNFFKVAALPRFNSAFCVFAIWDIFLNQFYFFLMRGTFIFDYLIYLYLLFLICFKHFLMRGQFFWYPAHQEKTAGGKTRSDLMKNKRNKVVSKKQNAAGKKAYANISTWTNSFLANLWYSLIPWAPFSLVGFYSERCNPLKVKPLAGDLSFAQVWSRPARSWASRVSALLMDRLRKGRHSMLRPRPSMPTLEKFNSRQFELAW